MRQRRLAVACLAAGCTAGLLLGATAASAGQSVDADPQAVAPAQDHRPLPSRRLVLDLLDWIGTNTGFDISVAKRAPPAIVYQEPGAEIDYEGRNIVLDPRIRGAYDADKQLVILVPPWSEDDVHAVSTLLHELIHHVQLQSREWDCVGQPEWQAYKLQEKVSVFKRLRRPPVDGQAAFWSSCG